MRVKQRYIRCAIGFLICESKSCHAPARLRVDANYVCFGECGYAAVCLAEAHSGSLKARTQAGCWVRLTVGGYKSATSTHETISSSIEPLLLLSGANY